MASSKPRIQVIGSLNIDFTTTTPRCPGPGETLTAHRLDVNAGGKGANQAVGCGRAAFTSPDSQNVDVEMIGAVGANDPYYASLLKPSLEKSGVSTGLVTELENGSTGTATIIVEEGAGGENRILVVPGANYEGMKDLKEVLQRSAGSGNPPNVVVLQGEIPRDVVLGVIEHYNQSELHTQVVFNPAPVWPDGVPSKTLKNLSTLVVNETECVLLTKALAKEGHKIDVVQNEDELTESRLASLGRQYHDFIQVKVLLVTLGSKGVFYSQDTGRQGLVPAVKIEKVVDTTAAGDTFVGYYATELARTLGSGSGSGSEFDVENACKRATAASAKCVSRSGALQSIPFGYE